MGKSGIGVGSASIVLVFAVLCLTVFSLITFVVAGNDKNLVDAKAALVTGYYEADALAELIYSDILAAADGSDSAPIPDTIHGVQLNRGFSERFNTETIYFFCDISDAKALYVNLAVHNDSFDILSWRMYDKDEWESNDTTNVWTGD